MDGSLIDEEMILRLTDAFLDPKLEGIPIAGRVPKRNFKDGRTIWS